MQMQVMQYSLLFRCACSKKAAFAYWSMVHIQLHLNISMERNSEVSITCPLIVYLQSLQALVLWKELSFNLKKDIQSKWYCKSGERLAPLHDINSITCKEAKESVGMGAR